MESNTNESFLAIRTHLSSRDISTLLESIGITSLLTHISGSYLHNQVGRVYIESTNRISLDDDVICKTTTEELLAELVERGTTMYDIVEFMENYDKGDC